MKTKQTGAMKTKQTGAMKTKQTGAMKTKQTGGKRGFCWLFRPLFYGWYYWFYGVIWRWFYGVIWRSARNWPLFWTVYFGFCVLVFFVGFFVGSFVFGGLVNGY
jgi:hypothetical protein